MPAQPTRRKVEPGVYERLSPDGRRLGLEIAYKDADGKTRRRSVGGGVQEARDALAAARTRRVTREREPLDPRVSFATVVEAFQSAHVAGLRQNSREVYRGALRRLCDALGDRRISSIGRVDVRQFVAAERAEGLKANTILSHLAALSAVYSFARDDLDMPVALPRLKPTELPRAVDDAREHRVLSSQELARVLNGCPARSRLCLRTLAETGARKSEVLGLTLRRIGADTITFREQLASDGSLAPVKTSQSNRTVEITRSLAAALQLAAGADRVFGHLNQRAVHHDWTLARKAAKLGNPQPVVHDLRHTHVSSLIADGWDPVEVAARIGDTLQTTLSVYSHAFDARRRSDARRGALEARYGSGMATRGALSPPITGDAPDTKVADLQVIRDRR